MNKGILVCVFFIFYAINFIKIRIFSKLIIFMKYCIHKNIIILKNISFHLKKKMIFIWPVFTHKRTSNILSLILFINFHMKNLNMKIIFRWKKSRYQNLRYFRYNILTFDYWLKNLLKMRNPFKILNE